MNNKVIYTCCVGGYDDIKQPVVIDKEFDYICFSNDIKEATIGIWKVRSIPYVNHSLAKVSRYPKLLPHIVLPEYDYSVYIDANIQIVCQEFYDTINTKISSNCFIAQVNHCVPPIDCIYDEIFYAYKFCKLSVIDTWRHTMFLKKQGFPEHYGLFENNLIYRMHNNNKVIQISFQWWEEFLRYSSRDQLSLMYVYWKNHYMPELLFDKDVCTRNSPCLQYDMHLWERKNNRTITLKNRLQWHFHKHSFMLLKSLFLFLAQFRKKTL